MFAPFLLQMKPRLTRRRSSTSTADMYTDEERAIIRKFPWMAEQLKLAFHEVKEAPSPETKDKAGKRAKSAMDHGFTPGTRSCSRLSTNSDWKSSRDSPLTERSKTPSRPPKSKVIFKQNMPFLVYNEETKKLRDLRVGGDTKVTANDVEMALNFNPGLKKITMDLKNILNPEKGPTVRLTVNYLSATTNYNPVILTEDTIKNYKRKEEAIKHMVSEIENRLETRQRERARRKERYQRRMAEIEKEKALEIQKEGDYLTANVLLTQSMQAAQSEGVSLTRAEEELERKRRIRLRTKATPTSMQLQNLVAMQKSTK